MTKEVTDHVANLLKKKAQSSGGKKRLRNFYQKGSHIQVLQTENLPKKQISWMYGLIRGRHGMVL